MNSHESHQWWIVATSRQVAKNPYKTTLFTQPLLIIREHERLLCILDRCPHRGYPLSQGQFNKGTIQCAYHGWKFNLEGAVIDQPGSANFHTVPNCLTQFAVQESQGYVWVALEKPESDTPASFDTLRYPHADYCNDIEAQRIDIMENFLDALHTHYVHSGIVRSKIKRHLCQVHIESIQNGYQATYIEDKQQTGALSRAFGGHIVKSIGRVLSPGFIQIDYCSQRDQQQQYLFLD